MSTRALAPLPGIASNASLVVSCYLAGLRRDLGRSMLRMVHADLLI
ncbi:MAG: hypothetical protein ACJ79V_00595 [Myxococcales bacterium]